MRILTWAFRLFLLFVLLAFSLNNSQDAIVHWFFGLQWKAPMVIVVLAAFACGTAFGVLAMVPAWWRHWRVARRHAPPPAPPRATGEPTTVSPSDLGPDHPPREGL